VLIVGNGSGIISYDAKFSVFTLEAVDPSSRDSTACEFYLTTTGRFYCEKTGPVLPFITANLTCKTNKGKFKLDGDSLKTDGDWIVSANSTQVLLVQSKQNALKVGEKRVALKRQRQALNTFPGWRAA
jgi:hypothetical protein